jgi:transcriptional regulator with XRE-family HTH domain
MGRESRNLLPKHQRLLAGLGENLKLARLRRRLSAEQIAKRAGISRSTLHLIESDSAGVSLGKLMEVLVVNGVINGVRESAGINRLETENERVLPRKLSQ